MDYIVMNYFRSLELVEVTAKHMFDKMNARTNEFTDVISSLEQR